VAAATDVSDPSPSRGAPETATSTGVAAFDFDGTLVPGDSLRPYLEALIGRRHLGAGMAASAAPMVRSYVSLGRDGAKVALLRRVLSGVPLARAHAVGIQFGAGLARRVRPELAERIAWHRAEGHRLLLVSASLTLYLDEFGRRAGFESVIATRMAVAGDGPGAVLTGAIDGANVRAGEKARRLQALLGDAAAEVWAYGDSAGDREMLAMADHPFRVEGGRLRPAPTG
jgi:HAD superfamily hydrolase (TIGR01490 family)